jgi:hypothetical protein
MDRYIIVAESQVNSGLAIFVQDQHYDSDFPTASTLKLKFAWLQQVNLHDLTIFTDSESTSLYSLIS